MKTSELIKRLVDSLASFGDIQTNITEIEWQDDFKSIKFETKEQ